MPNYGNDAGVNSTVLLRRITIFTFPPAFFMLIIHGVGSHYAFPALGLLPHAVSVTFGSVLLYRDQVLSSGSPIQALSPTNIFYVDVGLAAWYFAFLIPTWVFLAKPREDMIVLGTYASVFMMVNFAIHAYFGMAEALHIITNRHSPFKSLAAEYTPLNQEYRDDLADLEDGVAVTA